MTIQNLNPSPHSCAELFEKDGAWLVRLVEGDNVTVVSFANETFAKSYFEGQRLRLGLPSLNPRA